MGSLSKLFRFEFRYFQNQKEKFYEKDKKKNKDSQKTQIKTQHTRASLDVLFHKTKLELFL